MKRADLWAEKTAAWTAVWLEVKRAVPTAAWWAEKKAGTKVAYLADPKAASRAASMAVLLARTMVALTVDQWVSC